MTKINVLGTDWKVFCHDEDSYCKKYDARDAAFVLPATFEIHFNEEELNLTVVKHELWHAARASLYTGSAGLTADQEEEVSAELFAGQSDKLLRLARHLYKHLKDETDDK